VFPRDSSARRRTAMTAGSSSENPKPARRLGLPLARDLFFRVVRGELPARAVS
jgi:hypothetical protein